MLPNTEDVFELDVPDGETWRFLEVGMTDVGPPGQPGSSTRFETQAVGTIRVLAASNGTSALRAERDIVGPDKVRIVRRNSAGQREVTAWVSGIVFAS